MFKFISKVTTLFRFVRIEEYILLLFSIFLFYIYTQVQPLYSIWRLFKIGLDNIALGIRFLFLVFIFIYIYIFYKLYLYLIDWLSPLTKIGGSFKDLANPLTGISFKIKNAIVALLFLSRPLFFLIIFFTLITAILGAMAVQLKDKLVDDSLMKIDSYLLGTYPFIWFQKPANPLRYLSPLFIYSFLGLSTMMGLAWLIFYFSGSRHLFSGYIIAMSLVTMLALPFWYFWPANSPQNRYLNNVYEKPINPSLEKEIDQYDPSIFVSNFLNWAGVESGGVAPISTMPSMHVAWSLIIVYYFFRFNKRTIYFILPWALFSIFGTVYLAQHYFIDILAALPLTILAILIAEWLVPKERIYYLKNGYDFKEGKIKKSINQDLSRGLNLLRDMMQRAWKKFKV